MIEQVEAEEHANYNEFNKQEKHNNDKETYDLSLELSYLEKNVTLIDLI